MKKKIDIDHTFQEIRKLPLTVDFSEVEKFVLQNPMPTPTLRNPFNLFISKNLIIMMSLIVSITALWVLPISKETSVDMPLTANETMTEEILTLNETKPIIENIQEELNVQTEIAVIETENNESVVVENKENTIDSKLNNIVKGDIFLKDSSEIPKKEKKERKETLEIPKMKEIKPMKKAKEMEKMKPMKEVKEPKTPKTPKTPETPENLTKLEPINTENEKLPKGWIRYGCCSKNYKMGTTQDVSYTGSKAAFIKAEQTPKGSGIMLQKVDAKNYIGKRVKLSGYLKTEDAKYAGLYMKVTNKRGNKWLVWDNMKSRKIVGTNDWTKYETVFNVPKNGGILKFGVMLSGTGVVYFDDIKIEVVDENTPLTTLSCKEMRKASKPKNRILPATPANSDFEN